MPFLTTTDGTEIYYTEQGSGRPIVLSHGWPLSSDAWQVELKIFADAGYRVIAHDRRGHGRSSKTYQGNDMTTYAKDLAELVEHLDLEDVVVIGHSTGGLQAALWAGDHPGTVDAVILNSPWLDHNGPEFEKGLVTRVMDRVGLRFPRLRISTLTPEYAENLHRDFGGEWSFNPAHKPLTKIPVHAGFFRTVRRAQQRIARGDVHIHEPLLVAHSKESGSFKKPTAEHLLSTDVVLNVEDMKRLATILNPDATLLEVPGGRHDLALSEHPARDIYTRETIAWAVKQLGL